MSTPADDLRAAATLLAAPLPGDLNAAPHLVMTDAETVSGIAFCADHQLPREFPHEYSACDNCAVIDCGHARLAELLLALLLGRDSVAFVLDDAARMYEGLASSHSQDVAKRAVWYPLAFARAITGSTS
jgi:hypothetical protein